MSELVAELTARHGSRPFLVPAAAGGAGLTYAELGRASGALAAELGAAGVGPGDLVLGLVEDPLDYVLTGFALLALDAVFAPLDPRTPGAALGALADHAAARCIVAPAGAALADLDARWQPRIARVDRGRPCGGRVELGARSGDAPAAGDPPVVVLHTSGSTGAPKGVTLGRGAVLANFREYGGRMGFSPDTRFLQLMPGFHADGWNFSLLMPFLHGGSAVITPRFTGRIAAGFAALIERTGANVAITIPSMLALIADFAAQRGSRAALASAITSSEVLRADTKHAFEERFGAAVFDLYGLTETGVVSYYARDIPWRPGSVGKLQAGVEARFDDGELMVRSPYLFAGYWRRPEATAEVMRDGWLATGDLGHLDADGYLVIAGRRDDMINLAGRKVSARQIDLALREHPAVAEAATVAVDDPITGQAACAFAVLAAQAGRAGEPELMAHAAERLGAGVLTRVIIVDALPLTPAGKVDRVALRARGLGREST